MRRALKGQLADRPALAYLFLGGARHVLERLGQRMRVAYRDPQLIADAQMLAAELFEHDSAMVPWGCLTIEAEAFGCGIREPDDYYPQIAQRPLEEAADLSRLSDPDPAVSGRMPLVLEALTRLRERAGDDLFISAMVVSPFLVAAELRGMTGLMMDFIRDPDFAEALFERVTRGYRALPEGNPANGRLRRRAIRKRGRHARHDRTSPPRAIRKAVSRPPGRCGAPRSPRCFCDRAQLLGSTVLRGNPGIGCRRGQFCLRG